ncbi:MAG TPA: hypothetical protein VK121_07630 [Pseudogracilibacillus sp.]|nr:hypothetical protein [Pseudogracilibacillus sp.]
MKKKEEKIFAICIMMVCILILIVQCMINFPGFNYWITHDHGSVADWIGGVGTILAIVGGFQQINKQHKVDEAEKIENSRPYFACNYLSKTSARNTIILITSPFGSLSDIDLILCNNVSYRKIEIDNISDNPVYELDIKLSFKQGDNNGIKEEFFNYSGFSSEGKIILIPGNTNHDINYKFQKMVIRFKSKAGEMGFCIYEDIVDDQLEFKNPQYKYLKSENNEVKAKSFIYKEDLNNDTYEFDNSKMYHNGIIKHNWSASKCKTKNN